MEPADLNSFTNRNDDAQLEDIIRRAAPVLPDDGFSGRVLAALPTTPKTAMPWQRTAFCLLGAAMGSGFAMWQGVSLPALETGGARFAAMLGGVGASFANPFLSPALVVVACSLLVAFWSDLRRKFA